MLEEPESSRVQTGSYRLRKSQALGKTVVSQLESSFIKGGGDVIDLLELTYPNFLVITLFSPH